MMTFTLRRTLIHPQSPLGVEMHIRKGELELRLSLLTGAEGWIGDKLCGLAQPVTQHKLEPKSLQVTCSGVPQT